MHALHFGEGMARKQGALLVANPGAGKSEIMPAMIAPPLLARAPSGATARPWRTSRSASKFRAIYALADLAIGRAVFDSQFLRNSSRFLST